MRAAGGSGEAAVVDGSIGEGGGQILRTALVLSCATERAVRVHSIRAGRPNPGMRAQHVAAASALAAACGARVRGLSVGSAEVEFAPGGRAGAGGGGRTIRCDVGTAGSVTLILSALAVAASLRGRSLKAVLVGGTDVAWSPTADYALLAVREAYSRMGIRFSASVERRGYYPRGGGVVRASIAACGSSRPLPVLLRGRRSLRARVLCSHAGMPAGRAEKALAEVVGRLEAAGCEVHGGRAEARAWRQAAGGGRGGASAVAFAFDEGSVIGSDSLYGRGGFDAAGMAERFAAPGIGVDANLADMLVVPASLARGRSRFVTPRITGHLETNLGVAAGLTGCRYGVGRAGAGRYEVVIDGSG